MDKCKKCALAGCKPCYECNMCMGGDDHFRPIPNPVEYAPVVQGSNWISVKDRLPRYGTVLATDGRIVITAPSSSVTADGLVIGNIHDNLELLEEG